MADEIGTEAGFNFTYGVDIFPCEPWIIESTIDWGKLGSADLFHSRTTVGVIYKHLELLAGFDYLDIDHINLETMIFGVRVWY